MTSAPGSVPPPPPPPLQSYPWPRGGLSAKPFQWAAPSPLDDRSQAALNVGAILCTRLNDMPCDTLDTGHTVDSARGQISEFWGINSTVETRQIVGRLMDGMHSQDYEVVFPLVEAALDRKGEHAPEIHTDFLTLRAHVREEHPLPLVSAYKALTDLRTGFKPPRAYTHHYWPKHVRAWDFSRAPYVIRMAHTSKYIETDEAWAMLHTNLAAARSYYRSWRMFGQGVILGRMYWCALSDAPAAADFGKSAADAVNALLVREDSPWRRLPLAE